MDLEVVTMLNITNTDHPLGTHIKSEIRWTNIFDYKV